MLTKIEWNISNPPYDLRKYNEKFATPHNLSDEDYRKIVFRDPTKIYVPRLTGSEEEEEVVIDFLLIPDTPVGSTLKHTLDQIYRKMYTLSDKDDLHPASEIFNDYDYYMAKPYFLGLADNEDGSYSIDLAS